jgi:hypothetical protein
MFKQITAGKIMEFILHTASISKWPSFFAGTVVVAATVECVSARFVGMPTLMCTLSFKNTARESKRILLFCCGRLEITNSTGTTVRLSCNCFALTLVGVRDSFPV